MAKKFLDENGLLYFWTKIKALIPTKTSEITNDSGYITTADIPEGAAASTTTPKMNGTAAVGTELAFARGDHVHPSDTTKVDKISGKGLSTNDLTATLKSNYDAAYTHSQAAHAPSDAEANQNAFSSISDGTTTISAGSETDTLTIIGSGATSIAYDSTNKKLTISSTDNNTIYTHPAGNGASKTSGLYKFATDSTSHISSVTAVAKSDITALGIPAQDTTYSEATTTADGLMSSEDKAKLDGIAEGANAYTLPTANSSVLGGVKIGTNIAVSSGTISVADGSTSAKGVVQMSDSTASNVSTTAATSKAVKTAYDLANSKQSPATSLAGYGITDAYTKTEVDNKMASALNYKGTKDTYDDLPTTDNVTGDVWNITAADATHSVKAGDNVVWNGTDWDVLSGIVDLSSCVMEANAITNTEIDNIMAA